MPLEKTNLSPRVANCRGMKRSCASMPASRGKKVFMSVTFSRSSRTLNATRLFASTRCSASVMTPRSGMIVTRRSRLLSDSLR